MFEALKRFIVDTSSRGEGDADFAEDDYRLATAALLIHVANACATSSTSASASMPP